MRGRVIEVGSKLQSQLVASERSVDEGLIAHAELAATLLRARMDFGLNARVERSLIADAGAALAELFAHRERIINLHERMSALSDGMGINPRAFGDQGDKAGHMFKPEMPVHGLSVVSATA